MHEDKLSVPLNQTTVSDALCQICLRVKGPFACFTRSEFHDELLSNGSLPLSLVEWIMLDDPSAIEKVL